MCAIVGAVLLWVVLDYYIDPTTATERKDLVSMFLLSAAGVVGFFTAVGAIGNLYMSRRNLEQQRDLDKQRAEDNALQAYFEQMGDLLTGHNLMKTQEDDTIRLLAKAQTHTVLRKVSAPRKSELVHFLFKAGLIDGDKTIVSLAGADLRDVRLAELVLDGANLKGANLSNADLQGAYLEGVNLSIANLEGADLRGTRLVGARLNWAKLKNADLRGLDLRDPKLAGAKLKGAKLDGAIMWNGQKYEDWLKSQKESNQLDE